MYGRSIFLLVTFVSHAGSFLLNNAEIPMDIRIDLQNPVASTPGSKYIGVDIDTSFLTVLGRLSDLDLSSAKLRSVLRGLSPSYVRVGGTKADMLIFDATMKGQQNNTIGPSVIEKLWNMTQIAGWDIIFDVNVLVRKGGHWDPSNARELLQFLSKQGYQIPIFTLGNEPNNFPHIFNVTVSPQSLAQDYQRFKSFLQEFPLYRNSSILGPEVTDLTSNDPKDYFVKFLQAGGGRALSALGVHHYVCEYHFPVGVEFFTNITIMEYLRQEVEILTSLARQYVPHLPLWLDETSTTYSRCPGEPDIRMTYANGFLWLDKLGLSALYGIQHLNRQEMFWELVDKEHNPLPDYYLTLLYKRLVEGPVFKVLTSTPTVRVYAHCANPDRYPGGALTLYVINLEKSDVTLTFSQFRGQQLDLYMLTPADMRGFLPSKTVSLNGRRLGMVGNELPPLPARTVLSETLSVSATTFGFVVIPRANVQACKVAFSD